MTSRINGERKPHTSLYAPSIDLEKNPVSLVVTEIAVASVLTVGLAATVSPVTIIQAAGPTVGPDAINTILAQVAAYAATKTPLPKAFPSLTAVPTPTATQVITSMETASAIPPNNEADLLVPVVATVVALLVGAVVVDTLRKTIHKLPGPPQPLEADTRTNRFMYLIAKSGISTDDPSIGILRCFAQVANIYEGTTTGYKGQILPEDYYWGLNLDQDSVLYKTLDLAGPTMFDRAVKFVKSGGDLNDMRAFYNWLGDNYRCANKQEVLAARKIAEEALQTARTAGDAARQALLDTQGQAEEYKGMLIRVRDMEDHLQDHRVQLGILRRAMGFLWNEVFPPPKSVQGNYPIERPAELEAGGGGDDSYMNDGA